MNACDGKPIIEYSCRLAVSLLTKQPDTDVWLYVVVVDGYKEVKISTLFVLCREIISRAGEL
jgi:hypothetical protein